MSTLLDIALRYAQKGWNVLPVSKQAKKPLHKEWTKKASCAPEDVKRFFTGHDGNIGILCGEKSNLIVIDVDLPDGPDSLLALEKELGSLPETLSQTTGSGGKQLFFRYPKGCLIPNSVKNLGYGIDVRSNGGQVVVPPSIHPNGHSYHWNNDNPLVDLPEAWVARLVSKQKKVDNKDGNVTPYEPAFETSELSPYIVAALKKGMSAIAEATEGARNDMLYKTVVSLAGFISSGNLEEDLLHNETEKAFRKCHPEGVDMQEFENTFASAVIAGKACPREIPEMPMGFQNKKDGLYFIAKAGTETDAPVETRLGAPLKICGRIRDADNKNWGVFLEWCDPDGNTHREVLPNAMMVSSDSSAWRALLAEKGYMFEPGKKQAELLARCLSKAQPKKRFLGVYRTGWHEQSFVLPNETITSTQTKAEEPVLFEPPTQSPYCQSGTLESWKLGVAANVAGNSRLILALCAAFAGPLLEILGQETGGFNFVGLSSTGKTTALLVAASVWGKGTVSGGYVQTWRGTDNGIEAQAVLHTDTLLCLDELSQASPKTVYETVYMLGNSRGKSRATRTGSARTVKTWRVMLLSTGEQSLSDKLKEEGRNMKAGQAVRLLDIPADAEADMGLFENIHNHETAAEFAERLKNETAKNYGFAGPAFVKYILSLKEELSSNASELMKRASKEYSSETQDGQVSRAINRFALCKIAGLLARQAGLLPLSQDDLEEGIGRCFEEWLDERGGEGSYEDSQVVERLRILIERDGSTRFEPLDKRIPHTPCKNRAGFRGIRNGKSCFFIFPSVFEKEVCLGIPRKRAAKILFEEGILLTDTLGRYQVRLSQDIDGLGRQWLYAVSLE